MVWLLFLLSLPSVLAVQYKSSVVPDKVRLYTLIAMISMVVLPVIVAIVYIRLTVFAVKRGSQVTEKKSSSIADTYGSSLSDWKSLAGSFFARLADMKSNPVLRLWWKRQERMYKLAPDDEASRDEKSDPKHKKSKKEKEKKVKKEMEPSSVDVEEGLVETSSLMDSTPKQKKVKKEKRDHQVEQASVLATNPPEENSYNTNSNNPASSQVSRGLGGRRVSFAQ